MSALERFTFRLPVHAVPRVSLEAFWLWRIRRRTKRIERLAARQLAGLSPHMCADIGIPTHELD